MPQRLQQQRTSGWRKPDGAVCVGRPTIFGNPFKSAYSFRQWMRSESVSWSDLVKPADMAELVAKRERILSRLPELRGKDLLCWCGSDKECHADVLIELANADVNP